MAESEQGNSKPRVFKRRRSELISGVTVVLSIPLLAFAWTIYKDVRGFTDAGKAEFKLQIDAAKQSCLDATAQEKERAKERELQLENDIRELRSQVLTLRGRR